MKVEILYFEGCPNHAPAAEMVERVLRREGIQADVQTIEVRDPETAQTLRFIGSPSIRVNGVDIEPGREHDLPFYGCRTYSVGGKTTGVPPEKWLVDALRSPEDKETSCCRPGGDRGPGRRPISWKTHQSVVKEVETMNGKRQVELFSAGCPACREAEALVRRMNCPSCEVQVLDMKDKAVARRARELGIRSVPAVVVNGKIADCCAGRGLDEATLREAGIGKPVS